MSATRSERARVSELPGAITVAKTISEADVYLFAGITGDFAPVHVNASYAEATPIGERIAHGVLLVGLMSTASSKWCEQASVDTLSYGYEGVRFIRPIRFGDTISVSYAKLREESDRRLIVSAVEARNQHDEVVGVAEHLLWEFEPGDVTGGAPPGPLEGT